MRTFRTTVKGDKIVVCWDTACPDVVLDKNGKNHAIYECSNIEEAEHTYNTLRDAFRLVQD
jgi:hypothetical protein